MKKIYKHKSSKIIWRILISDSEKLLLECRDIDSKEVYFTCLELTSGNYIFKDFQLEEKYWIGIETFYNDIIFFHKYVKPDMPWHKGLIAFSVNEKRILWNNDDANFLFAYNNKIYIYHELFESREFFSLNALTGELIENFNNDYLKVNSLKLKAQDKSDKTKYLFTEFLNIKKDKNEIITNTIEKFYPDIPIENNIEYIYFKNFLLFNFHTFSSTNKFDNNFIILNTNSMKIIYEDVIDKNVTALISDSFFLYDNLLLLLKDKKELNVFKID